MVIRAWFDREAFTARMIVRREPTVDGDPDDADDQPAQVLVTDSIDMLVDSLRAVLAERSR